jgi:L-fuculose-phosphate aldolase
MAGAVVKKAQMKQKSPTGPKTKRSAPMSQLAARKAVIATALQMSNSGLSPGRSGNVSQRFGDGMLITPSGMAYDAIKPADIVFVARDGTVGPKSLKPSSEWRFHLAAYNARPDGQAIVHTHSVHATVLACTGKPIPAFHYMVAIAGGKDIPCVPYATFGTEKLSDYVVDGLRERDACLMANHGQITIAASLAAALELAEEIEVIAEQYAKLLAITSKPPILPDAEMADVLERFKGYGQRAQK